jgi:hypothetical protein
MENNGHNVTLIYESDVRDFKVTSAKNKKNKAVEVARLHYGILMVDSEEFLIKSSFLN